MSGTAPVLVHGTAVALGGAAALIRGASGSGKSDLALRCIALPGGPLVPVKAGLLADDQVLLRGDGDGLIASCPGSIAGKLEVRGLGIVDVPHVAEARLALMVELVPAAAVERMPEPERRELCGVALPVLRLDPFEASAPLKLLLCLWRFSAQNP